MIPRKSNELADKFSKTIDYDDWYVTPHLFKRLTVRQWVVGAIDTFASENNEIQFKTCLSGDTRRRCVRLR